MRLRLSFAKTDAMRFTGHLDLHHTWERTIRRANLSLAYTQGYSPHPRINLASALPLGFTSDQEIVDIWLENDLPIAEVEAALARALPPGIQVTNTQKIEGHVAALQADMEASEFAITLLEYLPDLEAGLEKLLHSDSLPRQRREKTYDLRPLILDLHTLPDDPQGHQRLFTRMAAREGATGRPEEVVAALGANPEMARFHRLRLIFREGNPSSR